MICKESNLKLYTDWPTWPRCLFWADVGPDSELFLSQGFLWIPCWFWARASIRDSFYLFFRFWPPKRWLQPPRKTVVKAAATVWRSRAKNHWHQVGVVGLRRQIKCCLKIQSQSSIKSAEFKRKPGKTDLKREREVKTAVAEHELSVPLDFLRLTFQHPQSRLLMLPNVPQRAAFTVTVCSWIHQLRLYPISGVLTSLAGIYLIHTKQHL